MPNAATWFYFSLILTVALFFQFTRPISLRNLDLLTLFLLVPGFLVLQEAHGLLAAAAGLPEPDRAPVPSQLPAPASRLYAHNVANVIALMTRDGRFDPDFADQIVTGMCITHAGEIRNERAKEVAGES